jgi:hypothetical protein
MKCFTWHSYGHVKAFLRRRAYLKGQAHEKVGEITTMG